MVVAVIGWYFIKEDDGTVTVKYQPWHLATSYTFSFDDVESANIFWESVYPLSVYAEHDPYITDDVSGWNMRSVLIPWYKRTMKSDEMRNVRRNTCAFTFLQPFEMRKRGC